MTISEDLQTLQKQRPEDYAYDKGRRENFDMALKRVREAVLDAEVARMDAEAVRGVMFAQARRIAELQAANEQLKHAPVTGNTGWSIPPVIAQPDFVGKGLDKQDGLD